MYFRVWALCVDLSVCCAVFFVAVPAVWVRLARGHYYSSICVCGRHCLIFLCAVLLVLLRACSVGAFCARALFVDSRVCVLVV